MSTEAQKRATKKYKDRVIKQFKIDLNTVTDADIIAKLETVPKAPYIKNLIREDMEREDKSIRLTAKDVIEMGSDLYNNQGYTVEDIRVWLKCLLDCDMASFNFDKVLKSIIGSDGNEVGK